MTAGGPTGILELDLRGHLSVAALDEAFARMAPALAQVTTRRGLLVDARAMTGYDGAARARFVDWHIEHRGRIERTAVLTSNLVWHMVITAMSLASRQPLRPFEQPAEARRWLGER